MLTCRIASQRIEFWAGGKALAPRPGGHLARRFPASSRGEHAAREGAVMHRPSTGYAPNEAQFPDIVDNLVDKAVALPRDLGYTHNK